MEPSTKNGWQFSLRSMLYFTALVAVVVAVVGRMPALARFGLVVAAAVLVLLAISTAMAFATSERRPLVAAFSWLLFGVFFAGMTLLALLTKAGHIKFVATGPGLIYFAMMGSGMCVCWLRAGWAVSRIRSMRSDNDPTSRFHDTQ